MSPLAQVSTSMVGRILTRLKARGVLREPPLAGISTSKRVWRRPYAVRKPKGYEVKEPGDLVQAVVMDMHEPFRQAVELCLPQSKVVVDKFHVLLHVNRALDQVRTSLQPQRSKKGEFFRSRYLLLTWVERLTPERFTRLMDVLGRYPMLRRAWALKEAFRVWCHSATSAEAEQGLKAWEAEVREASPGPFQALFPMLRYWRKEILNYFGHRYTSGFVEGKPNRIKVIKRIVYGYRNNHNFRQRILLTNYKEVKPKDA